MSSSNEHSADVSHVEIIKLRSNYLRGTIAEGLADPLTGAIAEDDRALTKFHGTYMQDDRDVRAERARQKLEPAYGFMVRARITGGIVTPEQWLKIDELAREFAHGSIRVTTRQTFQLHGVLKKNLQATIRRINEMLLSTIAACGDVNRNVICTPLHENTELHRQSYAMAQTLSDHLKPRTRAYAELWLNDEKVLSPEPDHEPIYGDAYLPRKFKIGIAIPPWNDIDAFANDIGFIAIERDGKLIGFNVSVGGSLGASHGEPATYPRLASLIGFCPVEQTVQVAEQIVCVQRDFGDRRDRKHARLKYTIDDRGLDWFKSELESRLGFALGPVEPFEFAHNGDRFGWTHDDEGYWHLTLFIPSGRIIDTPERPLLTGMREIAKAHRGEIHFTTNQNVIIARVAEADKAAIEALAHRYGLNAGEHLRPFERDAIACVALPTCGLAMAEAERYLPRFLEKTGELLERHGLTDEPINVRMTGCPNGCARPYVAEIALIGKAPGRYNLMLGGNRIGDRLNRLYRENVDESQILTILDGMLGRFARQRRPGESFGDYFLRAEQEPAELKLAEQE